MVLSNRATRGASVTEKWLSSVVILALLLPPPAAWAQELSSHQGHGESASVKPKAVAKGGHGASHSVKLTVESSCSFNRVQAQLPAADLVGIVHAVQESVTQKAQDPQSCFDELTAADRDLLLKLGTRLARACVTLGQDGYSEKKGCRGEAERIWKAELLGYKQEHGSAALERVLTAFNASVKRNQAAQVLQFFSNPEAAPAFQGFADSYARYLKALKAASYEEIQPGEADSRASSFAAWAGRALRGARDDIQKRLDPSEKVFQGNRRLEQERAAEALLWSKIGLLKTIQKLELGESERNHLIHQAELLYSDALRSTEMVNQGIEERRAVGQLTAGSFAAAIILVASMGSMGPALSATGLMAHGGAAAGGATATTALKAAAWGAASGATMMANPVSTTRALEMVFVAKSESDAKGSRMLCELSKQVAAGGEKAIRDTWEAAVAPGIAGGTYAGGAAIAARALPIVGPIINAVVGAGLLGKMSYDMGMMFGMRSKNSRERERTLSEVNARVRQGELPQGVLADVRREAAQSEARDRAELWGDLVMIGGMVPHATMFTGHGGGAQHGPGQHAPAANAVGGVLPKAPAAAPAMAPASVPGPAHAGH